MISSRDNNVLSVSELTLSIKTILELQYRFVKVEGEISNLRKPYSGHIYFTLKDSRAQVRAVMFKGQQRYLEKDLREGQKVICYGKISVYEARGEYQIIIDTVDFAGKGSLQLEYEKLKTKLYEEGLFLQERKKQPPLFPNHIGVITSLTGAALQDFLKISTLRKFCGKISIMPVRVQGNESSKEVVTAIESFNNLSDVDVIVITRGGGSIEDLWSFNEENVARAIFNSEKIVVTAIGHEIDRTIADFCADYSAHTPTAAAEKLIPDTEKTVEIVNNFKATMIHHVLGKISDREEKVLQLKRILGDLQLYFGNLQLKTDYQTTTLIEKMNLLLTKKKNHLNTVQNSLLYSSPKNKLLNVQEKISHYTATLLLQVKQIHEIKTAQLAKACALLDSVSPLTVLSRGYSIVTAKKEGSDQQEIISDASHVNEGEKIDIRLHKGELECEIVRKYFT